MARVIICDVCDETYTENRVDQQKVAAIGAVVHTPEVIAAYKAREE